MAPPKSILIGDWSYVPRNSGHATVYPERNFPATAQFSFSTSSITTYVTEGGFPATSSRSLVMPCAIFSFWSFVRPPATFTSTYGIFSPPYEILTTILACFLDNPKGSRRSTQKWKMARNRRAIYLAGLLIELGESRGGLSLKKAAEGQLHPSDSSTVYTTVCLPLRLLFIYPSRDLTPLSTTRPAGRMALRSR